MFVLSNKTAPVRNLFAGRSPNRFLSAIGFADAVERALAFRAGEGNRLFQGRNRLCKICSAELLNTLSIGERSR